MLLTLVAFVVALGLLIAVHEWGHYRMAVARGVKVLRFSVGFGKTIARFKPKKQRPGQDTEFLIGAIPFGGYVKMLDEREAPAAEGERQRAFNTQPLASRALIVAAGPLANLVLAVLLYSLVNWIGVDEPRALLSPPMAGSLAQKAGLQGGETVRQASLAGDELKPVASFETLRWVLTRGALDGQDVVLDVARPDGRGRQVTLPLSSLSTRDPDARLFRAIGIVSPLSQPVLGELTAGGAAQRSGLRQGDVVRRVGGAEIVDGQQLRELIRASGQSGRAAPSEWHIEREGRALRVPVQPDVQVEKGQPVGRIGAYVGSQPEMVTVRQGPIDGLWSGVVRVWEVSTLSLKLLGRMLVGELSLKNLSGPIAIADYAGKSASLGLTYYLGFLAFISVSLGVLNLLPVPVLDGGHLMYYLWEAVTGKPVTGVWLERLQYVGMSLLLAMMAIAMYNDIVTRLG
ncbi:RIP metalloprotease RseP [Ottowia testudinis]|uniref:Zinc metalloprotease n=1 Tax=Ottowia testudinis TaxID=2816950 RepID=A0A975CHA3_9BURK|nr:RIP metalloprotease RseP [Ottowia testudinis]QTD46418.1 RIP metalloprotease RseP [Ottowia testudinis]